MKIIFTLCSNNYLAQAKLLYSSVKFFQPEWKFFIGLVDELNDRVDYRSFGCEVIEVRKIESSIESLSEKYSIVELNTCVKPAFFQYFFEKLQAEEVIYLDPDILLYSAMDDVVNLLLIHDMLLTPHILTPIPLDGKKPEESLFLNYGIFNLGFLALKKTEQTIRFLSWWKGRTYLMGYDKPSAGLFTDQIWFNLVPLFFENVYVIKNPGYNMAPWNLHERSIGVVNHQILVNESHPLVFFHFSGFVPTGNSIHRDKNQYNRFELKNRPDLSEIFEDYWINLKANNYDFYRTIPGYYNKHKKRDPESSLPERKKSGNPGNVNSMGRILTERIKRNIRSGLKK